MRRWRVALGLALVAGLAGVLAPSAVWASSPAVLASAAPGGVTCALSATVSFSPPLTLTGGGTSPSAVTGTLSGCTTTSPSVSITGGTVSGSFASSPLNCATLAATGVSSSLSLTWTGSGSFTPTTITSTSEEVAANGNGDKGLALPGPGSSTATGSFAGKATAAAYSPDTGSQLTKLCGGAAGLASLTLTGTIATDGALPGWPQLHYGPDRTGDQPNETQIGTGNVGKLTQARTYPAAGGSPSAPLIANGILYVATNYLYAFSATGAKDCSASPTTCTPLWTAPTAYFDGMTVADGKVFVTDAEGVQAYDAAGKKDCSTTVPKTCSPLWATSTNTATGPGFTPGPGWPVLANGVLYVPGYGDGLTLSQGGAYVAAFDPAGSKDCTGTPKVCVPMWTTTGPPSGTANSGSPAIANGVIYLANETLYAFDAAGSQGCTGSGTAKVCAPLWTAATSNNPTYSAPAVANGTVYVGSWGAKLYAFDAAGMTNCSTTTPKTCTPLWTAATPTSIGGTPAVAGGVVYVVSGDGTLSAFDAAGSSHCSGPVTAKTCRPLWSSAPGPTGYVTSSSPAVANGVVYFSSTDGGTYGYDAAGKKNCTVSGTVKTCSPLWGAVTGKIGGGSPAVVDGVVFINVSGDETIYAYKP